MSVAIRHANCTRSPKNIWIQCVSLTNSDCLTHIDLYILICNCPQELFPRWAIRSRNDWILPGRPRCDRKMVIDWTRFAPRFLFVLSPEILLANTVCGSVSRVCLSECCIYRCDLTYNCETEAFPYMLEDCAICLWFWFASYFVRNASRVSDDVVFSIWQDVWRGKVCILFGLVVIHARWVRWLNWGDVYSQYGRKRRKMDYL